MKTYKIKLEDKAAFLNRLKETGVQANSYEIKDDTLKEPHSFTITFSNPEDEKKAKTILKQSPKINQLKEMKTLREQLTVIVREELAKAKAAKKQKLDELSPEFISAAQGVGAVAGVFATAAAIVKAGMTKIKSDLKKENPGMSEEEIEDRAGNILKGSVDQTLGKNVDMDRWQ
jgi:hypothetical protein